MLDGVFQQTNILGKALDASWLNNTVISNNIANNDTPNFKSSEVDFQDQLKSFMDGNTLELMKTDPQHMDIDNESSIEPKIVTNNDTSNRLDGNNVDIDSEMADLAKNTIYYDSVLSVVSRNLSRVKSAINGGSK